MLLQITEPNASSSGAEKEINTAPILGIDLGTTHSLCVVMEGDTTRFLTPQPLVPSVIAMMNGQLVVGEPAIAILKQDAQMGVSSIKRLMGRGLSDVPEYLIQRYKMAEDNQQGLTLEMGGRRFTPTALSAVILTHLKQAAIQALGKPVTEAVITVPAYFDEAAREATKDAARMAGLTPRRLLSEPTAAALAYGLETGDEGLYGVYDLGGGTFDVSVLNLHKGVFHVLTTGGDIALGGDDADHAIAAYLAEKHGFSMADSLMTNARLSQAACHLKEALSETDAIEYTLEIRDAKINGEMTRDQLDALIQPLIQKTLYICDRVFADLEDKIQDLKGIILVGGATHMPLVRAMVKAHFNVPVFHHGSPDHLVALGAGYQAQGLSTRTGHLLLDVTPLSLGVETMGGLVEKIIWRNTTLPVQKTQTFTTFESGQQGMIFHVVQGEREKVADCRSLAQFELTGIPPLKAGQAKIALEFQMDVDGLLTVRAEETTTGISQEIQVKPAYGMQPEMVEAMILSGLEHGQKDMEARLLVQAQTEAADILRAVGEALAEEGSGDAALMTKDEQQEIGQAIDSLKKILDAAQGRTAIKEGIAALNKATEAFADRRVARAIKNQFQK